MEHDFPICVTFPIQIEVKNMARATLCDSGKVLLAVLYIYTQKYILTSLIAVKGLRKMQYKHVNEKLSYSSRILTTSPSAPLTPAQKRFLKKN